MLMIVGKQYVFNILKKNNMFHIRQFYKSFAQNREYKFNLKSIILSKNLKKYDATIFLPITII